MSVRINNGRDSYLYCSMSDNPYDYQELYDTPYEAMVDITKAIEASLKGEYTEDEIERVIQHYSTKMHNYPWGKNEI